MERVIGRIIFMRLTLRKSIKRYRSVPCVNLNRNKHFFMHEARPGLTCWIMYFSRIRMRDPCLSRRRVASFSREVKSYRRIYTPCRNYRFSDRSGYRASTIVTRLRITGNAGGSIMLELKGERMRPLW